MGRIGSEWIPENFQTGNVNLVHESKGPTNPSDTSELVSILIDSEIDLILYMRVVMEQQET